MAIDLRAVLGGKPRQLRVPHGNQPAVPEVGPALSVRDSNK